MNILETLSAAITGPPAPQLDPVIASFRASLTLPEVAGGILSECGQEYLTETLGMVTTRDRLWREARELHTELIADANWRRQQGEQVALAESGQSPDPEKTWSRADFIEEQMCLKEAKNSAAAALDRGIRPREEKITACYGTFLGRDIDSRLVDFQRQCELFGVPYEQPALFQTLRQGLNYGKVRGLAEILKAVLNK